MCEVVAKDPKRLAAHGSVLALFMFLAEMRVPARGGRWGEVGRGLEVEGAAASEIASGRDSGGR